MCAEVFSCPCIALLPSICQDMIENSDRVLRLRENPDT
jgi:hypothetical protein